MLSVDEALRLVVFNARPKQPARVALVDALGLVLAEDVASDVDSPPHDKAIVDGYAVIASDLAGGSAELEVIEEITAGAVPTQTVASGQATRVMTGAPIPPGANAMVMIERTELLQSPTSKLGRVRIQSANVAAGQNITRQGASFRRGEMAVRSGAEIRAIEIGVLAEVGCTHVGVIPRPTVAVLATGNELVPVGATPAAGQIRNSNSPMLAALVERAGGKAIDLGIARDDPGELRRLIADGLEADVLVLSGGVSAGVLDLVPGVLAELGVEQVFHKLKLKPGKPLWFGVRRCDAGERLVFGLPGNPVSSLVCFELFVRPAIGMLRGAGGTGLDSTSAILTSDYQHRGDRPTYHPARLAKRDGATVVEPLKWHGSGDLRTLVGANALASFPAGDKLFHAGEQIEAFVL